jgi:hypothetical protein
MAKVKHVKGGCSMTLKRGRIILALVVLLILSQFIPINRSNPPVKGDLRVSQALREIFTRSCFDCHSNETVWPWYSRIAPLSWLVAYDVYEGRQHLNFSTWGDYSPEKQAKLRHEIWESVDEGEMPPLQYYPTHFDARLSEQDKVVIRGWTMMNAGAQ